MNEKELDASVELKCPNCGKLKIVKGCSIQSWLTHNKNKTRHDYDIMLCNNCKQQDRNYHYIEGLNYDISTIEEQRGIICGMLFGDGGRGGSWYPNSINIRHCIKQEKYALFKRDILNNITGNTVATEYMAQYHPKFNKSYDAINIRTKNCPIITDIIYELYQGGHKIITQYLLDMLTLQGLAIWYMDDGSCTIAKHHGIPNGGLKITLNTYLPKDENAILANYFEKRWGIRWNNHLSHGKYRLAMGTSEGIRFFNLIRPYIIPEMLYKLPKSRSQLKGEENGRLYKYTK